MNNQLIFSILVGICLFSSLYRGELVSANPVMQLAQSIWSRFYSPEGSFTILMPGTPNQSEHQIEVRNGVFVTSRTFSVERQQDSIVYAISYVDFPINPDQPSSVIDAAFDSGRDNTLSNTGGQLVSERAININGYPGREIKYITSTQMIGRVRMYFVKGRLYDIGVETNNEKYLSKSIEGFLNSFQLLSK